MNTAEVKQNKTNNSKSTSSITSDFMQENKAREVTEVQRRHRDRLQCAAKRRSTATCSTRDKEMDGVALESVLQNLLTSRVSRRRLGRPSSSHGSPIGGSPKNGSLSEITSQINLSIGNQNQKRGAAFREKELGKKEWNSAGELTENFSQNQLQSKSEDVKAKCPIPPVQEIESSRKEDSKGVTAPVNRAASIASSGRSFSAATEDGEDELQDNNEEEAQRLREASRKVLRFQNSRGSVSSGEFSLENQKSPGATTKLPRQRTFDEETERYPGDPTNEDLVRFLLSSQTCSKRNLGRRHTLPTKVPKTEEEQGNPWAQPPVSSPSSAAREQKGTPPAQSTGQNSSNQVFDFTNVSNMITKSDAQDPNSPSAEKKTRPNSSATHVPEEAEQQIQEGKSVEPTGNHLQKNSENIQPKSTWFKTESSGFLSFFKRLGDMSKLPANKETAHKGTESGV